MHALPLFERTFMRHLLSLLAACALALGTSSSAWAHKASDAYLALSQDGEAISLRWDVALRDLDAVAPLDSNDDGQLTWGEVKAHQVEIEAYLLSHWGMRAMGAERDCVFTPERAADGHNAPPQLERRIDGTYYVLKLQASCPSATGHYAIRYGLMRGVDPTHRGLLHVLGMKTSLISLSPQGEPRSLTLLAAPSEADAPATPVPPSDPQADRRQQAPTAATSDAPAARPVIAPLPEETSPFVQMWHDGIHHILIGTDHILFLLCLLLPAVLRPQLLDNGRRAFIPVAHWREAMGPVLMTVTMFTLAHSITLALAALKLVSLSPRLIEPAIALTIALAALDNLHPIFRGRRYLFTFLFGLVHGFGFAGALTEMNLPMSGFVQAVLAFNLGVETGQLLVVLPAMALLLGLRRWSWYGRGLMPAGSLVAMAVAAGWFVERVFDLGFMPL